MEDTDDIEDDDNEPVPRMTRELDWLHYKEMYAVLYANGFVSKPMENGGVFFTHPNGAELAYPAMEPTENVISHHYAAARVTVSDWGIMTGDEFYLEVMEAEGRITIHRNKT